MQKIHQPHVQPVKTGTHGPKLDGMDMQNNPFRAAYHNGHDVNESYKVPAPNAAGENHSYMRPVHGNGGGSNSQKLQGKQNKPAGPIQTGKNSF
jgi:hypothetical protein